MRSPKIVLENLAKKANDPSYKYERIYRNLFNPEFYWRAYQRIYSAPGNMTKGVDGRSIDEMSEARVNRIIKALKDHSYQPSPARRTYIPKGNSGKKRPLGIQTADDKLVEEVIRMILESVYEPNFSNSSHGFRPNRSCHTALCQIKDTFSGINWFVEGDIKACFDSFDHHVLVNILRRRFADEAFIELMWKFLRAGYLEQWEYRHTYSGTPQGSGMSPILANIYLTELDTYIEEYTAAFSKGTVARRADPRYNHERHLLYKARKRNKAHWESWDATQKKDALREIKGIQKRMWQYPSKKQGNEGYKRLQYCRYADDFIIGVIGSKQDALKIKADLKAFLADRIRLTMSDEKTKVTHSGDKARFLGYDITCNHDNSVKRNKDGELTRPYNGRIQLLVPREKWQGKLAAYEAMQIDKAEDGSEKWHPIHRGKLVNKEDFGIISQYNAEIRGLYNYYSLAHNATVISKFAHIMEYSMYRTFANKYKTSMSRIIRKYSDHGKFRVAYQTKQGTKYCYFYDEGFKRKKDANRWIYDVTPEYRISDKPYTLAGRLRRHVCELCGQKSTELLMHHIRKLTELTEATEWERLMKQKRRKTLAVCPQCHDAIHGRKTKLEDGEPDTSRGVRPAREGVR